MSEGLWQIVDRRLNAFPPLNGKVALRYVTPPLNVHFTARFSDDQYRLGKFEEGTDGYIVYDAGFQLAFLYGNFSTRWLSQLRISSIPNTASTFHESNR